jgi:hypothetical protein
METLGFASGKGGGAEAYMKHVQYVGVIYTMVEGES